MLRMMKWYIQKIDYLHKFAVCHKKDWQSCDAMPVCKILFKTVSYQCRIPEEEAS